MTSQIEKRCHADESGPRLLPAAEVASHGGPKKRTLRRWAKAGRINHFKIQNKSHYDLHEVLAAQRQKRPNKQEPVFLYVPAEVDFEACLGVDLAKYADRARYIVHVILERLVQFKGEKSEHPGIRLSSQTNREVVGRRRYASILKALEEAGIVAVRRRFAPKRCYEFFLAEKYLRSEIVGHEVRDNHLRNKLRKLNQEQQAAEPKTAIHKRMKRDLERVEVHFEAANACLDGLGMVGFWQHQTRRIVDQLRRGNPFFVPGTTGRVFTSITNVKREMRQFLHVRGLAFVEVDVANSQPLLVALAYAQWAENEDFEALLSIWKKRGTERKSKEEVLLSHNSVNLATSDACIYRDLCQKGELYHHLLKCLADHGKPTSTDRLKEQLFNSVFFCGEEFTDSPLVCVFQQEFPSIYQFVLAARKEGSSRLAGLMQGIEAHIVIDTALRRLHEQFPDEPFLTVHDSILAFPERLSDVEGALIQAFTEVGLTVTLRHKNYSVAMNQPPPSSDGGEKQLAHLQKLSQEPGQLEPPILFAGAKARDYHRFPASGNPQERNA